MWSDESTIGLFKNISKGAGLIRVHAGGNIRHIITDAAKKNLRSSVDMSDSGSVLESMYNRKDPTNTHPAGLDIFKELDRLCGRLK
ncbi:hypothetical protein Trydic_g2291 [Trypoxylus dichotomus]